MKVLCLGPCQEPTIPSGTVVETESLAPEAIRNGDLVVFLWRRTLVCHRVLYRRRARGLWWFYLKADNTGRSEGWVPHYRIQGKVTAVSGVALNSPRAALQRFYRLWKSRAGLLLCELRLGLDTLRPTDALHA